MTNYFIYRMYKEEKWKTCEATDEQKDLMMNFVCKFLYVKKAFDDVVEIDKIVYEGEEIYYEDLPFFSTTFRFYSKETDELVWLSDMRQFLGEL